MFKSPNQLSIGRHPSTSTHVKFPSRMDFEVATTSSLLPDQQENLYFERRDENSPMAEVDVSRQLPKKRIIKADHSEKGLR